MSRTETEGPLHTPPRPESSRTCHFLNHVNAKYGLHLSSYEQLFKWSTDRIDDFWSTVWDQVGIIGTKGNHVIDLPTTPADNPVWFSGARMNWAENMLQVRTDKNALVQATEPSPSNPSPPLRYCTYRELYDLVADVVSALLHCGLKAGDRVASYSSNCIENVAACLASTAIGCIWVTAATDFATDGVLDRFEQIHPSIIFSVDSVAYNGKDHVHLPKVATLLEGLEKRSSIKPKVVIIQSSPSANRSGWGKDWSSWEEFTAQGKGSRLGRTPEGDVIWNRQGFNWPLWILFSSGTTGRPKPIVHRAGGMLLQSKKELVICADLSADDVFFYYTTTGWMMWNYLVGALSLGATLVLYDGSPLKDPAYLWNLVDTLGITVFGTSAKYLDQLSKGYTPIQHHKLTTLRHIYSTGSPLAPVLFDFVYKSIKPDVLLASITGGTDICSLFAGMCTALPVYRGEIQCRMLGMAIEAFSVTGDLVKPGEAGELVCLKPFPCQPVGFWPLPGFGDKLAVEAASARYHESYFSQFEGVWYHGDHVVITPSRSGNGGGLIMLGRSDGVLNPGGIRFGSSELYEVIETYFSGPGSEYVIKDCLAVGQAIDDGQDERVILFVELPHGKVLSADFEKAIKAEIRARRSPRHVPPKIIQIKSVPYTLNGKRVEVLIKKIINGIPVSNINLSTLGNPECLDEYVEIGRALRGQTV